MPIAFAPNDTRVLHVSPLRRGIPQTIVVFFTFTAGFFLAQTLTPHAHATAASPTHGAQLFVDSGCSHCHGPAGIGGDRGPDLKDIAHRMSTLKMTTQIHDGGQSMPPFSDVLTPQDITDLVAYLRAKRKPPIPPPHPSAPPL